MLIYVPVRLSAKELEALRQRIGFTPDRNTARAWARSLILETLQPSVVPRPVDETAKALPAPPEPRSLLEVVR